MENKHSEEKNDQNKKNLNDINKESSNSNIKSPLSSNEGSSNSANELKAKNIRIKEEKKKLKKGKPKTHSLKLSKLGGDAFEAMISYKIANKFFIEDIETDVSKKEKNFTAKQILDINEIKKEIIDKLSPVLGANFNENTKKKDISSEFQANVNLYFKYQNEYNNIYVKNDSSMSYSSEISSSGTNKINNLNKKKINNKNLTELEFDLFLKNVKEKNLLKFLDEMKENKRLIVYKEIKKLLEEDKNNNEEKEFHENKDKIKDKNKGKSEDKKYNVCIEITVNSNDILKEKISQLYKAVACFNFLYETNKFFETKERNLINDSYDYFLKQTKFMNFKDDLIFITISNGKIENFQEIQNSIENKRKEENFNNIKYLDNINNSYNIYMLYYPTYDDNEIGNLQKTIDQQKEEFTKTIGQQKEEFTKMISELKKKIAELEMNQNKKMKKENNETQNK